MDKFLRRLQKIKKAFIKFRLDRRQKALEEWNKEHPEEYALWISEGRPDAVVYKTRRQHGRSNT
tara:strand:- start:7 stop:198 length:192 start_codon:yes stop_codon:yes gene_type:complete